MKMQSKWGIEVEAQRWYTCPHCEHQVEISVDPTSNEFICDACEKTFFASEVKVGRLSWEFLGEIPEALVEEIIRELKEDAEKWGATFTVGRGGQVHIKQETVYTSTGNDEEQPQACTGCGEIGSCRCAELDDSGHLINVSPEDLENEE